MMVAATRCLDSELMQPAARAGRAEGGQDEGPAAPLRLHFYQRQGREQGFILVKARKSRPKINFAKKV